jgi:hypothetical protein
MWVDELELADCAFHGDLFAAVVDGLNRVVGKERGADRYQTARE